jgi:hypothetical protein
MEADTDHDCARVDNIPGRYASLQETDGVSCITVVMLKDIVTSKQVLSIDFTQTFGGNQLDSEPLL